MIQAFLVGNERDPVRQQPALGTWKAGAAAAAVAIGCLYHAANLASRAPGFKQKHLLYPVKYLSDAPVVKCLAPAPGAPPRSLGFST